MSGQHVSKAELPGGQTSSGGETVSLSLILEIMSPRHFPSQISIWKCGLVLSGRSGQVASLGVCLRGGGA